ncbi:MAG: 5-methylthioadenosine/S-adenosylhomocysteine deaminase [Candidatus Heimdallarchaeota archaeon LC_3]|nr:MAG: 5-methylthioadenosine/S-adenosylhomocysteine deaminase [Candidatus Heimdallarchaeota archaeon LC_3]
MESYTIDAGWLLTPSNKLISDARVITENKKIIYLGKKSNSPQLSRGSEYFVYPKGLILPPFVNGHTHLPETLIRGICDDQSLQVWLNDHIWKVEPVMNAVDAKIGALLGIAEMISNGIIAFNDQYFYADSIAEAVKETGVKAFLSPSIFEHEGQAESKTIPKSFQKNIDVFNRWHKYDDRIFIGFGPHATYSIEQEWLAKITEATKERNTKMHIHLNETKFEVAEAIKNRNCSPIALMDKLEALPVIMAAHCVHTDANDRKLLAKHQTIVLSCPQSNLKIAAGITPLPEYINQNIQVCLGTDGSASNNNLDMLEEVRLISLIHKGLNYDPTVMNIYEAYALATSSGANIFSKEIFSGALLENSPADIVVANLNSLATTPIIRPFSNFIYSAGNSQIVLTMSNGKLLYKDGKFLTINIENLKESAQRATEGMIDRSDYTINSDD